jgi:predicted peroxiredoxin|tara:strand:- start:168 stop:344 length:177 start_codon:yes stop_codon:yes gene_type:complete
MTKKKTKKIKVIKGFYAKKEKPDLQWTYYYDGMEGGAKRVKDYMDDLKRSGYKIEVAD